MQQRDSQLVRQADADITGVCIMTVDDIRRQLILTEETQGIVCEGIQVIPQTLLCKVGLFAAIDADDADFIADAFLPACII